MGRAAGALLLCVLGLSLVGRPASLPVLAGVGFSDLYGALAPLFSFHRSYADFLFLGTPVRVPPGIDRTCEESLVQIEILRGEVPCWATSTSVEAQGLLTGLQTELGQFCGAHLATLAQLAALSETDSLLLEGAADEGLFAGIGAMEEALNLALDRAIAGFRGDDQWGFSVAFAMETLVRQRGGGKLDLALAEILLGSERTAPPPGDLPDSLVKDLRALASLCGRGLEEEAAAGVEALAERILGALLAGS